MKVENSIVYRVATFEEKVEVMGVALPKRWKVIGEFKQRLENSLERHRPNGFPSREKCLYVCFSKENAYEWASCLYKGRITPYKLLTLEISGELFWFKSDCYNFLQKNSSQTEFDKASIDYWDSLVEDESKLTLDKGYEGLFVGESKIIAIEYKQLINGESIDVE